MVLEFEVPERGCHADSRNFKFTTLASRKQDFTRKKCHKTAIGWSRERFAQALGHDILFLDRFSPSQGTAGRCGIVNSEKALPRR